MTRNPWRSRDGKKVLKAAGRLDCFADVKECLECPTECSLEHAEARCEKVVREWLVEMHGALIAFSPAGVVWSVNSKTTIDLGNVTRIKTESASSYWGHDEDVVTALIAAGLAVLKGEKA